MTDFKLKLCAVNPELYHEWEKTFREVDQVSCHLASIFDVSGDALVSPANAFGYMDGGIDQRYTDVFGEQLQKVVQIRIQNHYYGELPVGQAFVMGLPTTHKQFKHLVVAPTMRVPEHISGSLNAYHAFRAILIATIRHNQYSKKEERIRVLLCPGLGTGIGALDPKTCAKQMHSAYHQVMGNIEFPKSIFQAFERHEALLNGV